MKMFKLLVINPDNDQVIIEVGKTGSYHDDSKVLWNEINDGPLPANAEPNLGGLSRTGTTANPKLTIDPVLAKAAKDARDAAQAARDLAAQNKADRISRIKTSVGNVSAMTTAQLKVLVGDLVSYLEERDGF